jgi:hypothetical protein
MNRKSMIVFCVGAVLVFGMPWQASCQPVLERLEQSIRNRVPADDTAVPAVQPAAATDAASPAPRVAAAATSPRRVYLGATVDDKNDRGRGVRVMEVRDDGPASKGGLQVNDLITALDGNRIRQMSELGDALTMYKAGSEVTFDVLRGEKRQQLKITLAAPSDTTAAPPPMPAPPEAPTVVPTPAASVPPAAAPRPAPPSAAQPAAPAPAEDLPAPPKTVVQSAPWENIPVPPKAPASGAPSQLDPWMAIDQLRRRVEQLERRVQELEKALDEAKKR